jgi:hypothetical protein
MRYPEFHWRVQRPSKTYGWQIHITWQVGTALLYSHKCWVISWVIPFERKRGGFEKEKFPLWHSVPAIRIDFVFRNVNWAKKLRNFKGGREDAGRMRKTLLFIRTLLCVWADVLLGGPPTSCARNIKTCLRTKTGRASSLKTPREKVPFNSADMKL